MKTFGWDSEEELRGAIIGKVVYEPYSPQKVFFVTEVECIPDGNHFTLTRVYAINTKGVVTNLGGMVGSLERLIEDHRKKISTHEARLKKMMEFGKAWMEEKNSGSME